MDHFLQLVPLENDSDAEQGIVYGDDEAVAAHLDEQVQLQSHAAMDYGTNSSSSSENVIISAGETTPHDAFHDHNDTFEAHDATDEHERQQYLARIESLNAHMQQAKRETQQRLDAMVRILALTDPLEQLSEYMALKLDDERQDDVHAPALNITSDLLECTKRLRSSEDSEVALLGAFFFACDPPPCPNNNRPRGVASMLPVVAAMMESATAVAAGLEHPF
ncbi:hypothetical protein Gpo141_00008826 [Globisporangium polare]